MGGWEPAQGRRSAIARIPKFDENGNLPRGVYRVGMKDIEDRFTWNRKRRNLFKRLEQAVANLAGAGVNNVWIAGSFVTAKEEPQDVDGCCIFESSVDADRLDPVFLDKADRAEAMKRKYGVDFLIARTAEHADVILDFLQEDKEGNRRGILLIETGRL